jgi:hypothetical protein
VPFDRDVGFAPAADQWPCDAIDEVDDARSGIEVPCVTSIVGPHGGAQLY